MNLKKWEPFMAVILLILVYVISSQAGKMAAVNNVPSTGKKRPVVVIDAGHGGNDPGKIGIDGSLEKDINLQIAMKLKKYLEASDVEVVLTRDNDNGLYSVKDNRKKMADMTKRCEIINKTRPALTVSIHQNSYHQEEVSGGQVFYYKKSEKGKKLAEIIQDRFDFLLGEKNTRLAKPNDNYYLLLHVRTPIVIVECGFLTNKKESALLNTEDYQDRVAWTIHMGIMRYLNER
ncbi:N-acetylmuramoyl-L-alanine amidase [Lacrimispora amygdalina]|uniref:N-acetylmuramoyl-L-alanine amidase n=2 Tax=Lacrimispora amygdalina TaxID=253257 RepID=A0A3E2N5J6_9FIRM|nr:N-acetylmuramoyl-L-alanine amidase [Clostridium indicum]